ncbi:acylase [Sphingopyxis lindanitolerans]|uniref:Acylase n=1 Tax=Sphingopyxis lindanitolerans TaxID=2054227 RepID=A0A2S8B781_9SPHN|nr:penicillin acylase family protein [Sphingopyxis lindanitolerans]PQM28186.1 acylase [Sphingopyxis lindanitolerans]
MRKRTGLGLLLGLWAVAETSALAAGSPHYTAEIRRTSFGIPHIKAADEASLGFGLGYAYAQDNFCMFAEEMVTVAGERSRYFAPEATGGPDIDSGSVRADNRTSDYYFRLVNEPAEVAAAWNGQPAPVKARVTGYVAGINRYLADTGAAALPVACRSKPWVRPLTTDDIMRLMRRYALEGSSLQFVNELIGARPPAPGAAGAEVAADFSALARRTASYGVGSNAVALGKDATSDGRGLLLGNPHYPWQGILRFYQFHLTMPGQLDVMGAALAGLPVVNIGFTRDIAWSHTVNTSAHFTLHALTLDPADPTRYRVGDRWLTMEKKAVSIAVGDKAESHDFWQTIYGPVVAKPGAFEWSATTAYALGDANADNNRMIEMWHAMDSAPTLAVLASRVQSVLGLPWVNTIAADRDGRALYLGVTVVPNISAEKQARCVAEPYRALVASGVMVLDGSDPACGWDQVSGLRQSGVVPGDRLPLLWRSDYVQNSNDSAWLTNARTPLTGYPEIVSAQDVAQGGRTRMGIEQIDARLAGTDGRPGKRFDARSLHDIAFSNRVFYGGLLHGDIKRLCAEPGSVVVEGETIDLAAPCATLTAWDGTASPASIGYPLFAAWWNPLEGTPGLWTVPFDAHHPVTTPHGLKLDDPAIRTQLREGLGKAVVAQRKNGIDWTRPWGDIQYIDTRAGRVPVPGGAGGDVYNSMYSVLAPGGGHMVPTLGSSYIQIVGFDDDGPVAKALLAYSNSSDPASPHSDDQAASFAVGELKPQPFTDAQIKADPAYRTMTVAQ